jgi:hypothetical protein
MGPGMTRDFEVTPQAGVDFVLEVDTFGGARFLGQPTVVRFRVR